MVLKCGSNVNMESNLVNNSIVKYLGTRERHSANDRQFGTQKKCFRLVACPGDNDI